METPGNVSKYVDAIRDIDVDFMNSCAVAGGFNLPEDPNVLQYLDIDSIFERLFKAAEGNIVFASEMGEKGKENKGEAIDVHNNKKFGDKNKMIRGLEPDTSVINDTCVISSIIGKIGGVEKKDKDGRYTLVKIEGTDKLIASIHLAGDGPKKEPEGKRTIKDFLHRQLPNDENVCMFCGDTNITTEKTEGGLSRLKIGKQIASALNSLNRGNWVVFMSDLKIDKMRSGFILYNQQLKKSTYKKVGVESAEADGTILAIKTSLEDEELTTICANTPSHYSCYTACGSVKDSKSEDETPIYTFHDDVEKSLDDNNQVKEKVFLDHSVLQLSTKMCNEIIGEGVLPVSEKENNVIVLNLGSIANSGKKNWNTKNIKKYGKIVSADKALYEILRDQVPNLPEFDKIEGSNFTPSGTVGIDKVPLKLDADKFTDMMAKSRTIISELKAKLGQSGGRRSSRKRKSNKIKRRKGGKKSYKSRRK
jgi:hypothetical protein